ncbi:MAG: hypothetical protein ACRCTZ_15135 [Sarcina sp.]
MENKNLNLKVRVDEQTHKNLSYLKKLYGCETISETIRKIINDSKEREEIRQW